MKETETTLAKTISVAGVNAADRYRLSMVQNLKIPITSKLKKYIVYLSVWTHRNTEAIQLTVTLYRKKMLLAMQKRKKKTMTL